MVKSAFYVIDMAVHWSGYENTLSSRYAEAHKGSSLHGSTDD